ncbi:MAG: hypothetical protein A2087_06085 [Spirochaetes bacterium GWD1_61_31]|nr:MAG: hypothetical protein A2Y37_13150 [Spirochaetes bacterium GWB1_60_80]OHD30361.1 MAG: hypothetical protein A2004_08410 [Spirochaetes bacterium GWC1_61_12]OHD42500.1 MAG: hypothetical protein A2Y35_07945 [Spirochaetes bacterium GWE1_60_18]OHD43177.1 MAG: hypothetical protein A2087_06085 [Spirochaetes bacterium GWD1_61_31]OHD58228.1 MAG: hypothetical protein A2Y32_04865 [Spirochaetes bacterium GWF1_60_12]HAP42493.1 hypothetical protein [Spirochaetaceae bacterium]
MKRTMVFVCAVLVGIVALVYGQDPRDYMSATIGVLKYVPAGRFQRDGTAGNISLITQPYRMSQHEITRTQFRTIMGADPSEAGFSSGIIDPVQMVNWYQAIAFSNKLSLAENLTPVYAVSGVNFTTLTFRQIPTSSNATWDAVTANWSANGYRLPTEMEWMWAAMGALADGQGRGTNTTGYTKAFAGSTGSNAIGDYAVFGYMGLDFRMGTAVGRTSSQRSNLAGSKLPNELGLYDMSGNVWEWCWDWYADNGSWPQYAVTGTVTDHRGAASGSIRVLRGGSWFEDASICRVATRGVNDPGSQNRDIGFRVVRP